MKNQTSFMLIALIVFISFLGCQESKDSEKQVGSEYSEQIKQIIEQYNPIKLLSFFHTLPIDNEIMLLSYIYMQKYNLFRETLSTTTG